MSLVLFFIGLAFLIGIFVVSLFSGKSNIRESIESANKSSYGFFLASIAAFLLSSLIAGG